MNPYRSLSTAGLLAVALCVCAAVSAAEIERGLPPNTTAVLTIHVKRLLHAPLVKRHGLAQLRHALADAASIREALTALAFDPLRDLDRLTIAKVNAGKKEEFVLLVRGRFDTARFRLAVKKLAKEHSDRIAAHKTGNLHFYSVVASGKHGSLVLATALAGANKHAALLNVEKKGSLLDPIGGFCVTLADKNTLIAASSEELLKDACKRMASNAGVPLNKPMHRLLAEVGGKQTIAFALRSFPCATERPPETSEAADSRDKKFKDIWKMPPPFLEELNEPHDALPLPPPPPLPLPLSGESQPKSPPCELSGGIAVADDFKLRCTLRAASKRDAKETMKGFDEFRLRMDGLATLLAGRNKKYAFLKEIPNSFLAVRKGRIILIAGHLSAETLGKLLDVKVNVTSR